MATDVLRMKWTVPSSKAKLMNESEAERHPKAPCETTTTLIEWV